MDLVLVATSTADEITPNAAPLVAGLIGPSAPARSTSGLRAPGGWPAWRWHAGRSSPVGPSNAVVVGADFPSRFLDPTDRSTAPLFAEGAGPAVISAVDGDGSGVGRVILHSDHSGADLIRLERGKRSSMQGQEMFRAAVSCLSEVTREALAAAGLELEDVDLFVYHQANSRIIGAVGRRLGLDPGRVVDYFDRFANSSTATLPIALSVAEVEGRLHPGDAVLLAAVGGGFTWGATVVRWDPALSQASSALRRDPPGDRG